MAPSVSVNFISLVTSCARLWKEVQVDRRSYVTKTTYNKKPLALINQFSYFLRWRSLYVGFNVYFRLLSRGCAETEDIMPSIRLFVKPSSNFSGRWSDVHHLTPNMSNVRITGWNQEETWEGHSYLNLLILMPGCAVTTSFAQPHLVATTTVRKNAGGLCRGDDSTEFVQIQQQSF